MSYKGIDYLRRKLNKKRSRVNLRYKYYEQKKAIVDSSNIIPAKFNWLSTANGWCTLAVDRLADRLTFREFKDDAYKVNEIFRLNNPDIFFDSAMLSALISSCCFVYISADEDNNGYPRLQVIDGANATGVIDSNTQLLQEGYAVLERDPDTNRPTIEAYFTKEYTAIYYVGVEKPVVYDNPTPYPLLVPIIYKPDAKRPFGHSRISRACMSYVQGVRRTLKRAEVAAEFYSYPQKYMLGVDPKQAPDKWKATISSFLMIGDDEDGNRASVGQFQQQSMAPFLDQLNYYAKLFAGETGLTVDDLGFVSDNPSSEEAIIASHENLRITADKAKGMFGSGFKNVAYLAKCLEMKNEINRSEFISQVDCKWEPTFKPGANMLGAIGDGVQKLNLAVPGYAGKETVHDLTGIEAEDE